MPIFFAEYKLLRVSGASTPILQYWQQQAADYPVLSTVACRLLCIPASSAQSESDFSSVGRTITDARSQLAASKVESIELLRWGLRAAWTVVVTNCHVDNVGHLSTQ